MRHVYQDFRWRNALRCAPKGFVIMLGIILEAVTTPVYCQQIKIESGAFLISNGANIVVNTGIVNAGTISNSGTTTIKLAGNWQNDGTFTSTGTTLMLQGSSVQQIGGTSITSFENLTMNNNTGAALSNSIIVNNSLAFTYGRITTGNYILTLGTSASVTGAGTDKYVNGNLSWSLPVSGSASRTFYVGDLANYTPVTIDVSNITVGGTINGSTTAGAHPDGTSSGISGVKRVNRYWTLANNGVVLSGFDATFTFVAGDILGGANSSNFIMKKWEGASWSATNINTRTTTTTKITALTSFGDFLDGESGDGCVPSIPPDYATASPATICSGSSSTLVLSGGGGGTYETVEWFTGSCAGTPAGTGNNLSVSPGTTTTYYGRYANGSPCSDLTACEQVVVTVIPSPAATITPSGSTTFCLGGSVDLTASGGNTYLWSTASTTAGITASTEAIYSVTVTSANGCSDTAIREVTVYPVSVGGSVSGSSTVCAGINTTELVLTGHTGSVVKWQSSTNGTSWYDIAHQLDTYTAADVTMNTWYRAVVQSGSCDPVYSEPGLITTVETGHWLGTTSNDWNDDANWCGGIPGNTTDVTITGDAPNMPEIGVANGTCRNLIIHSGASLTMTGNYTLSVFGNWSGSGTFIPDISTVTYSGDGDQDVAAIGYYNLNLRNSGTKTFSPGTTGIEKNFTLSENAIADATTNSTTIDFNGDGAQNVAAINYHNLIFSNAGVKSFSEGTTGIGSTFTISGTASAFAAIVSSTINYNGANTQTIRAINYNHLTFSNAGTKNLPATSFGVAGDWTNNGTVAAGTSTVTFNGNSVQSIGGSSSTTFTNCTVNNSYGVVLTSSQTITGMLTMSTGTVTLGNQDLLMGISSGISGYGSTRYVVTNGLGALRRRVVNNATDVTFPVGLGSGYLPVSMQLTAGSTTDDFKIRVTDGLSTSYDGNDIATGNSITSNAVLKTWSISEGTSGGSNASITLNWTLADEGASFNRSLCDVSHYTGNIWVYTAFAAATGSDPYARMISGITSFSPFAVFGGQSITCTPGSVSLCPGGTVSVDYAATGSTWNAGNVFTAQLSSVTGSFISPVAIGTLTSQTSGTIYATIPSNTTPDVGYRIRVVSNSPSTIGVDNGTDLVVDRTTVGGVVSSSQTICGGTMPSDLTLTGNTGDVIKWQKASDAAFTSPTDIAGTSATLSGISIGALTTSTYFRAVVQSGSCNTVNSASVLISISGYVGDWLGVTSTDWNTASNWCGGVPADTTDVTITAGVTYMPVVGTAGGTCRNITISSGASLVVNASSSLSILGNLANSGTVTLNAGTSTTSTWLIMAGNVTNNTGGVITATDSYIRFIFSSTSGQTLINNGTITSPVYSFDVANAHASGLTLTGSNGMTVRRVNLFYGSVTNSDKITIGSGGTSSSYIQRGSVSNTAPAGSFDTAPSFNTGTGGLALLYDNASVPYSTGYEVPPGTLTVASVDLYDAADVALGSDLTVTNDLGFAGGTGTPKLRFGAHTLTLGGTLSYAAAGEFYGGPTSNLTVNAATTLQSIVNGLNNLSISANTSITGAVTVNGTLTLSGGVLIHESNLTMASGSTISRSSGSLATSPIFAGTVNLTYTGSSSIITGFEMPTGSGVLNNLTTNTGGVVQNATQGTAENLLTDSFTDLTNWTGDLGNTYNQYSAVVSANAGGTANEGRYYYGSGSATNYTAAIYRSINTAGRNALNIKWKQFIDNYDATTYPYTVKVQCASSSSGPWTDIYTLSPAGTANLGPETKVYYNWTTNVGAMFYIRYYITGLTYGIDYWYFDDLIIESPPITTPSTVTVNNTLDLTNGTYSIGANTLVLNGDRTGGNALAGGTTSNLVVGGTGSNFSLPAVTNGLNNFMINRPNGVSASTHLTVHGNLNLQSTNPASTQGCLDMGGYRLTMGINGTTTGAGDVTGIIKRTSITHDVEYTFGNRYTSLTFSADGTPPDSIMVKVGIGAAPSWKTGAVSRTYDIVRAGGVTTRVMLALHYLDSELNSNDEAKLVLWDMHVSQGNKVEEHGKSNADQSDNWVDYSAFAISYFPTTFNSHTWALAATNAIGCVWLGSYSTLWNEPTNWSCARIPISTDTVYIQDADNTTYDPTLPATGTIKTLTIGEGGILNGGTGTSLTIGGAAGAWFNEGEFNAGTSNIIFTNAAATMADPTTFYDVTINAGAGLTLEANNTMRIAGTMTNNGTWNAALNGNLVEYNGSAQTIVNPNGSPAGYHDLILNGSGVKTLPASALSIGGGFTVSGTSSTTAVASMDVAGNFTLGSGSTYDGASFTHSVGGNWINNGGTFTGSTSTVVFDGSSPQIVGGSSSTTFNNLTVDNGNGLTLSHDVTINETLAFTDGKIATGANTLQMGASASVTGAGAGKYVYGNLRIDIPEGDPTIYFVIGDATWFTPVTIDFSDVTGAGSLSGTTVGTHHPQINGSGINALKTVNRYWSFTNTSTAFDHFNATFTFVPEDVDPGADYVNFVMKRWDGSVWHSTTVGTKTPTTTQITGATSFSDFQDGEACIASTDPTSASATATTICRGDTTMISIAGGGGGSNETIQWYTGSCGGAPVGNGNGLRVSPLITTTYYGRYENSSSCQHYTDCSPVTITVNEPSADPVSASASFATICSGQSTTLTLNGGGGGTAQAIKWYSGSCGETLEGSGNDLLVSPATTTSYYGRYENGTPCNFNSTCQSVTVTVYITPTVSWPGTLDALCETATNYALSGGIPEGGSYSGTGVTGAIFNASVAGIGDHVLNYTYTTADGCSNTATNTITVYARHSINGNFTYYNSENSKLANNVVVGLYNYPDGTQAGTDYEISGTTGHYEFTNLCPGTYEVRAVSTLSSDGGVNTTDAAQVNYWGAHPYTIEKVRFYAGDVTGETFFIQSSDAQRIQANFVNGTNFDRPDWTFWRAGETISYNTSPESSYPVVTVSNGQDVTANFYGLCTGDFNRSFVPGDEKSASAALQLTPGRKVKAGNNQEVGLNLSMAHKSWIGAISLVLNFPADLVNIKDVLVYAEIGHLDWSVKGNELRIGWNSSVPVLKQAGDHLIRIMLQTRDAFTTGSAVRLTLAPTPLNELADNYFEVIEDAVIKSEFLEAYSVGTGEDPELFELALGNYPNPFSNSTTFSYLLPFDGVITLEIRTMIGSIIAIPINNREQAGAHSFEFVPANIPPGVYFATLNVDGKDFNLSKTIKIVIRQ